MKENNGGQRLAMLALNEIPTPNENAQDIVALVKKGGRITGYKLADGQILDKAQGVALARDGGIRGVGIATRNGTYYLKSLPDEREGNNLGSLPSVTH
jgi:hypothetical protein